jgi:hypothetical protein
MSSLNPLKGTGAPYTPPIINQQQRSAAAQGATQPALIKQFESGMNQFNVGFANTPSSEGKWVPAKGPSVFSQVFKLPPCLKNAMVATASVIQNCFKAVTEYKVVSEKSVMESIRNGSCSGFSKLSDEQKIRVIQQALDEAYKGNLPNDKIIEQLINKKTALGKAFETICDNARVSENLEFLRNAKSYQKDGNSKTLENLKENINNFNLPQNEKKELLKNQVESSIQHISFLLVGELKDRIGKLSLKKETSIENKRDIKINDLSLDNEGNQNDLINFKPLFKPKNSIDDQDSPNPFL